MMSIEEKKLLKDMLDAIYAIDEHLESRRILASISQIKLNAGL